MKKMAQFALLVTIGLIVILLFGVDVQAAAFIYVNASATGSDTGDSWGNAYTDLQDALVAAEPWDEIWVAAGTYVPGVDQTNSFQLVNDVAIYGGFAGTGPNPNERDWEANETILSGDINGDDDPADGTTYQNNSLQVVASDISASNTAVLDGFTISGGNASVIEAIPFGGGLYNVDGSPTLKNLVIDDNGALYSGGGMYNDGGSPVLDNVTFSNNNSPGNGGGLWSQAGSLKLTEVEFTNNYSSNGGGMYSSNDTLELSRLTFTGNSAQWGGGLYNENSDLIMSTGIFSGNIATGGLSWPGYGGGLYLIDNSGIRDVSLTDVSFVNNSAVGHEGPGMIAPGTGGGMHVEAGNPKLFNAVFDGNSADEGGGASSIAGAGPSFFNSAFINNFADENGGGIAASGTVVLRNANFISNTAVDTGGGMYNANNSSMLSSVTFSHNSASFGNGGALYNFQSFATLANVAFIGNAAAIDGGGLYEFNAGSHVTNAVFVGNVADNNGGGLFNTGANPTFANITFSGNDAANEGGAAYVHSGGLNLDNSIVWGNTQGLGGEIVYVPPSTANIQYSLLVGGPGLHSTNIDENPLFVINPSDGGDGWGDDLTTIDVDEGKNDDYGDIHLRPSSPAIDAANNGAVPFDFLDVDGDSIQAERIPLDLTGFLRFIDNEDVLDTGIGGSAEPIVDMGAIEWQLDNIAWPLAYEIPLTGDPDEIGYVEHSIDTAGQSRWYKFNVHPGSQVMIELSNLSADYDLIVFQDIQAMYDEISDPNNKPEDIDDLIGLTIESAPYAYSPYAYSPYAYSPYAYSPYAYSPYAYSPYAYSPYAYSPYAYSPYAYSPYAYSPYAYSPYAYSPYAYSPYAYSPYAYSPYAYSPYAYSPYAYSPYAYSSDKATASAEVRSVIGISAFEGTADEFVAVNTWENTGEFYVRVAGRNGAFSLGDNFHLKVTQLTGDCKNVDMLVQGAYLDPEAGGYETIILTDLARMGIDPANPTALENALDTFAVSVDGVVVDVGADAAVSHFNSQADDPDNLQCPMAKNLVARSIKRIVDGYWSLNEDLEYVVVVGNDDVIPFYRHLDRSQLANESDYDPPVKDDTTSYASLALGYVLGQDYYGSSIFLPVSTSSLPLPHLAVGRLVETEADIMVVLNAYASTTNGTVVPGSALVTGYDFLEDAALAIECELEAGIFLEDAALAIECELEADISTQVTTLIADQDLSPLDPSMWTADDLRAELVNKRYDIAFLAGHFTANGALAADYQTDVLASEVAASAVDMSNAIIFSAGCHSGYNIVDDHGIPNVTLEPDWAQAFAGKGATLIAGTGYQYGDTDFLELSERLYFNFSRQLRAGYGPVPIGNALVLAKQDYLAGTPELRGIHEKVLIEASLFGLPMLKVDMPYGRGPIELPESIIGETVPFETNPGAFLDLNYADITITPTLVLSTTELSSVEDNSTLTATFYQGGDGVVSRPAEPVLPLERRNVSVPDTVLRGIGFRGATYHENEGVIPLTGAAATEVSGVHVPFTTDVFFPIRLLQANYFDALANPGQGITWLSLIPAQFLSDGPEGFDGTLRLFDDVDMRLYYSDNTEQYGDNIPALAGAPALSKILATSDGINDSVDFQVTVVGDMAAGVQEAWVVYTLCNEAGCNGSWQPVDLAQNADDSSLWEGTLANLDGYSPADVLYMVQAANGTGLVSFSTNFGQYYTPDYDPAVPPAGTTETTLNLEPSATSGQYNTEATFTATLTNGSQVLAGETIDFIFGTRRQPVQTDANGEASITIQLLALPSDEPYFVRAYFEGSDAYEGSSDITPITITKLPSVLTLSPNSAVVDFDSPPPFTVTLVNEGGQPLREKIVFVIIHGEHGSQSKVALTNPFGQASLGSLNLPVGSYVVDAYYGGEIPLPGLDPLLLEDPIYQPSTDSGSLIVEGLGSIIAPVDPVALGNAIDVSIYLSTTDDPNGFTAEWDWGDNSTEGGAIDPSEGGAIVSGAHTYNEPGVYSILVTITNNETNVTITASFQYIVVYDPEGGFVTGGGWISSPVGACIEFCSDATGQANFGFVSKYKKGAQIPTGKTVFHFKAGDLKFQSASYEWLVIAGAKAKFKGVGTINGAGNYGFMISAVDAKLTPSTDVDLFRIKIWEKHSDADQIIYDNQMGDSENNDPTTAIGGGSITIHK